MNIATVQLILKLLDILSVGLVSIPSANARYKLLRNKLQVFIDEGRDPTPGEFDDLMAETTSVHERIQGA